MKRWIRLAAWLYPVEWRMRYGAEFDVLLDDALLRWSDLGDVIRVSGLQDQLGLKLERTKSAIEILMIEHVEKPTAN